MTRFWFLLSLVVFALSGCDQPDRIEQSYTVHGFSDRDYTTRVVEVDGEEYIIFDSPYSNVPFVIPKGSRKKTGLVPTTETDFELLLEGEVSGAEDQSQSN